jgi:hypothetical protein
MRLVHKATDGMGAEATRIMVGGFRTKLPYRAIARQIAEQTGEKVAERTVARRGVEWRSEQSRRQAAREQMQALVDAMKEGNWSAAEMIQALATDALMQNPEALTGADPLRLQGQNLKAEELRIKREEMDLRKRGLDLDVKRFEAVQEREQRAVAALEDKTETLTPEERLRRIRELYGLRA